MRRLLALTTFACLLGVSSPVMAQDRAPVVTAPATASVNENSLLTILVTATDPDGDAITSFTASGTVMTAGATFAANGTNTSGTLSWTPTFTQSGSFSAIFTATNALSGSASTTIIVGGPDRAPVVTAPATASVIQGSLLTINVTAGDPDGEAIASLTASGSAITAGGTFSAGAGNVSGTFRWTPTFTQTGTYSVTFTALNSLSGFATTSINVVDPDRAPIVTAPATRIACENALLTFTVGATDPDGDAITSLTASGTVITAGATFTVGAGNTSGTLSWTPTFTQAGSYGATFTAQNALSGSASTAILVGNSCDRAPVVIAPATQQGCPGELLTFTVAAVDPDGEAITGLTASGSAITAGGTFTSNVSNTSGTFSWTPAATGTFGVTFTAVNTLTGQASTAISVSCGVRPAVGAPATASVNEGSLLTFTVTATEPDGPAFVSLTAAGSAIDAGATFTAGAPGGGNISGTFSWTPNLTQAGAYSVTFTATSNASGSASTSITVMDVDGPLPARAFTSNSYRTIRLSSGKAFWCASVEPLGGSFDVADIVPTSVVLISPGTGSVSQISAVSGKGVVIGDADRNDVVDVTYCFRKEDLRLLFSDIHGKTTLDVTLAGTLTSGRPFNSPLSVEVIGSGGGQAVSVAPNPFNPSGVLSVVSTRSGIASIRIFDHTGRLVRTLEQGTLPAGRHDVRIDGRDESGRSLATGIYFYRVDLVEGTFTGRFAILK